MKNRVTLLLACLWLCFAPAGSPAAEETFNAAAIDALLTDALKQWGAPGVAVAIVKGDEVIYLKGQGVREKGRKEAVTPDTVFGIGSLTKAISATALGLLVDDGKVKWDDPVRKHVPFFELRDSLADRDVTLRDLLCHRTGLPRHDLLWYRAPWSLEETVRRISHLELAQPFRSGYGYNNIAYITVGFAITSASGTPWNELVRKRLLLPLGMKHVVFTRTEALATADHASPHLKVNGQVKVIPWYDDDRQIRASGSVKTSVRDLSAWLRFQLNGGVVDGKRLISAAALEETHTPQVPVRADHNPIERDRAATTGSTQMSYGLGWRILEYRGEPLLEHGGAVDGFRARIMLLPKRRLGVVLLLNLAETEATTAIGNTLLDHLLKLEPRDWHAHYRKRVQEVEEAQKTAARLFEARRRPGTKPSLDLEAYAGRYLDPAFGTLQIRKEDESLHLTWSGYKTPLRHYHFDTFALERQRDRLGDSVTFALDADGEVATVEMLGRTFKRQR